MNKKTGLTLIILTTILAACTAQAAPAPTELTSLPPTATAAAPTQPSATARPTAVPTVTPTPLSPDAQVLKDIVFSDCIPVEQSFPVDMVIPWNILVEQENNVYFLNPENGTRMEVPRFSENASDGSREYLFDSHVSPDGKWLAYNSIGVSKLIVEPIDTLLENSDADRIVWERDYWFRLLRWVDNEKLFVIYRPPEKDGFMLTVFLNPFTGEEIIFRLEDLPNYLPYHLGGAVITTHYFNNGELAPDPTGKKILYPEDWDDNSYTTLWDVEARSPLARVRYSLSLDNSPIWSQDSSDAVLISSSQKLWAEVFLVAANGDVRQVTNFSEVLQSKSYYLSLLSRSGDGRFIIFRYSIYDQSENIAKYIILDLKTNTLEGYCIPSRSHENSSFASPIWSPDSKYIVISNIDSNTKGESIISKNRGKEKKQKPVNFWQGLLKFLYELRES